METKFINYSLPEFVFLDGNSPNGDTLNHRTVIQHIRSFTILEVVHLDEHWMADFKSKTFDFEYKNRYGATENIKFALHFSLSTDDDDEILQEIFEKSKQWYCEYLDWEDKNIDTDNLAINN